MNILIIEDDIDLRKVLVYMVHRAAPRVMVRTSNSVEDALGKIAELPTDIVLLDIMLPGISGLELLKTTVNPEFHTICMTAKEPSLELQQEVLALGAVAMLWKPFEADELKKILQNIIKMRLRVLNEPIGSASAVIQPEQHAAAFWEQMQEQHTPTEAASDAFLDENPTESHAEEQRYAEEQSSGLPIRTDEGAKVLHFEEIQGLEADNVYTIIHCTGGISHTVRGYLSDYEAILPKEDFLRVNRTFIVRLSAMKSFESKTRKITLAESIGKKDIIVAASKIKPVRDYWKARLKAIRGGGGGDK